VDVVITDLTMPKLRGDRLIASLRRRQPGILLILSTGYQDKIDSHKAAQMGADALLIKPYGKNKLSTAIRKVLDLEK
jgi:CheY-like chemotaxis protein